MTISTANESPTQQAATVRSGFTLFVISMVIVIVMTTFIMIMFESSCSNVISCLIDPIRES